MADCKLQMVETRVLKSLDDTRALAKEIAKRSNGRLVLGLQGEMGSGKTHFVKALAEELGAVVSEVSSPTFAVHQQYTGREVTIHHIDLFRLESEEEVESSGFWDLFYETDVILAVEWIDRIAETQIPENFSYVRLQWEILDNGDRKVTVKAK
jgi:tRNA threonylcarbamoyladenosine biosynthesis protein TsaE